MLFVSVPFITIEIQIYVLKLAAIVLSRSWKKKHAKRLNAIQTVLERGTRYDNRL